MQRVPMRKIRDVLRLRSQGLSNREISLSLGIARSTVGEYVHRADVAGLSWPLPTGVSDADLDARLFPVRAANAKDQIPAPNWADVHKELRAKGVTLWLLWEEYRAIHPDGYGYSRFCELYKRWEDRLTPTMRQRHVAGEKLFVDYAGMTLPVICPQTGEVHEAQVFVATMGASNLTFAEATLTQSLPDWIGSHTRAFAYLGGAPEQVVCDNLKSGITKACFYDPAVNRTYAEMAAHYGTAIVPARVRKPKDKAKVEVGVQIVERFIMARLRKQTFFSLAELNAAIRPLVDQLNAKTTRHLGASRADLYARIDRPAMKVLPADPYDYGEWKKARAGLDYHVEVKKHYYSVPYTLMKKDLWVRIGERTLEVFHQDQRVAAHARSSGNRYHTTLKAHMPPNHRFQASINPTQLRERALRIGPNVHTFVDVLLAARRVPEQGYRSCLGVLRLADAFSPERLDAACEYALGLNRQSYSSLQSILKNGMESRPPHQHGAADGPAITHNNIRGATYFH